MRVPSFHHRRRLILVDASRHVDGSAQRERAEETRAAFGLSPDPPRSTAEQRVAARPVSSGPSGTNVDPGPAAALPAPHVTRGTMAARWGPPTAPARTQRRSYRCTAGPEAQRNRPWRKCPWHSCPVPTALPRQLLPPSCVTPVRGTRAPSALTRGIPGDVPRVPCSPYSTRRVPQQQSHSARPRSATRPPPPPRPCLERPLTPAAHPLYRTLPHDSTLYPSLLRFCCAAASSFC